MKTISIRLEDSVYEELGEMLEAMGQTKQTFYETYTKTELRERSIPFIISAPVSKKTEKKDRNNLQNQKKSLHLHPPKENKAVLKKNE